MLDAFIIEQIRKRDRQEADDRPTLSIPAPMQMPVPAGREPDRDSDHGSQQSNNDDEGPRGVIVIDFA